MKKDPGIPNLFPYKDKILQEIEEKRQSKEAEAVRRKDQAKARQEGLRIEERQDTVGNRYAEAGSIEDHDDALDEQEDEAMDQVRPGLDGVAA